MLSTGTACKATWVVFGPDRRPWSQHQQQVVGLQAQDSRSRHHLPPVPPATAAPAPAVPARGCTSSGSTHPGRCLRCRGVSSAHHSTLDGSSGLLLGVHVAHTEELAGWLGLCTAQQSKQGSSTARSGTGVSMFALQSGHCCRAPSKKVLQAIQRVPATSAATREASRARVTKRKTLFAMATIKRA